MEEGRSIVKIILLVESPTVAARLLAEINSTGLDTVKIITEQTLAASREFAEAVNLVRCNVEQFKAVVNLTFPTSDSIKLQAEELIAIGRQLDQQRIGFNPIMGKTPNRKQRRKRGHNQALNRSGGPAGDL